MIRSSNGDTSHLDYTVKVHVFIDIVIDCQSVNENLGAQLITQVVYYGVRSSTPYYVV